MCNLLKRQSVPDIDIDEFDSNPINYHYFIFIFKEVIESKTDDPQGCLARLIKYTKGEAKEIIKHCIQHPPKLEYQNALILLEKQYGDPFRIMSSYRKEIKLWPEIRAGDTTDYRNYYNFLLKCQSICSTCKESNLDFPEVLCVLISKLPGYVRERWNRKVLSIRRTHKRNPKLFDLPRFVEEESMLVNDPLFSKERVKFFAETGSGGRRLETRPGGRREKDFKKGKHSVNSHATGMLEIENKKEASCQFCEGAHKLDECEEIIKKRVEERSKLIGKKKLCYGCLEPMTKEHNAKNCKQRLTCKTPGNSDLTVLHGYTKKVRTNTSTSVKSDIKNSVACISNCLSHEVLSMCILPIDIYYSQVQAYTVLDNCSQGTFIKDSLINDLKISRLTTSINS